MNNDKVNEVRDNVTTLLQTDGVPTMRSSADLQRPGPLIASSHALWMAQEARTFPAEKLEKKMRWLGFIQGVLWSYGRQTITTLKQANMPDAEKS